MNFFFFLVMTPRSEEHIKASLLFFVSSREMKTYGYIKTCIQIFIVALFVITKNWKQMKCPSAVMSITQMSFSCPSVTIGTLLKRISCSRENWLLKHDYCWVFPSEMTRIFLAHAIKYLRQSLLPRSLS